MLGAFCYMDQDTEQKGLNDASLRVAAVNKDNTGGAEREDTGRGGESAQSWLKCFSSSCFDVSRPSQRASNRDDS